MTLAGACIPCTSYGRWVMDAHEDRWPEAGMALLGELRASRGRLGLIVGDQAGVDQLVESMVRDLGLAAVQIGSALSNRCVPPGLDDLEGAVGDATIICDLDMLCWPVLGIPPLAFLASLARRRATLAVWPGEIGGGRARYSQPGRPDHIDLTLHDTVVLRPRTTAFPDECPYETERIAR
jgi:hypothetical protein